VNRDTVSRARPETLQALARHLRELVGETADTLRDAFQEHIRGGCGQAVRGVTSSLFERWCEQSLAVTPSTLRFRIQAAPGPGKDLYNTLVTVLHVELRFPRDKAVSAAARAAALDRERALASSALDDVVWELLADSVDKYIAQTAHVFVARLLMYRIGEDKDLFPERISGASLQREVRHRPTPVFPGLRGALSLVHGVRGRMADFLPAIYQEGEFDWWNVHEDQTRDSTPAEAAAVRRVEGRMETVARRALQALDCYEFSQIDVDVWHDVYQHYMPWEERQRLGGFYTPEELVGFVLDLAEYDPSQEGLCARTFIDPASGSGTFVVAALSRLVQHLNQRLPCHKHLHQRGLSSWRRSELVLGYVEKAVHAVDIHPFAAFLTTVNTIFQLLEHYRSAREHNPEFQLNLAVFAADSLEPPERQLFRPADFARLNSRIQRADDAARHYRELLGREFDYVFGNPPWGGVLKGRLSPVFDEGKKKSFRRYYPHSAVGKYDIYGLFIERAFTLLKPGGRMAFVTQNTYAEKEWASSLRLMLTEAGTVRWFVDIGPFGQLFFGAMNTPSVTVVDKRPPTPPDTTVAVIVDPSAGRDATGAPARRRAVLDAAARAGAAALQEGPAAEDDGARAFARPATDFAKQGGGRWVLGPEAPAWLRGPGLEQVTNLLEARQGVTPGGALDIFLLDRQQVDALNLELEVVFRAFKSREIDRWRVRWSGRYLLYPYGADGASAFALTGKGLEDALDFQTLVDRDEEGVVRGRALDSETAADLLEHRIGRNLVLYPNAARYLTRYYDRLANRVFKKRNIRQFGRQWYEYLWPRVPQLMLAPGRIVTPTLVRTVRFAVDFEGVLSDHGAVFLLPQGAASAGYSRFADALAGVVGELTPGDVLLYITAFLNSTPAQETLVRGRLRTPKGSYAVNEAYLDELRVRLPKTAAEGQRIVGLARRASSTTAPKDLAAIEAELDPLVQAVLRR
jgi:hypothetical protein